MLTIHKKLVVDEHGTPHEVILPWEEYRQIEELLGLDLSSDAVADLEQAAKDRQSANPDAYEDLDSICNESRGPSARRAVPAATTGGPERRDQESAPRVGR